MTTCSRRLKHLRTNLTPFTMNFSIVNGLFKSVTCKERKNTQRRSSNLLEFLDVVRDEAKSKAIQETTQEL